MFRNARIPMQNLRNSAVTSNRNGATTSIHSLPDSALTTVTQKLNDEKLKKIDDWMASLDWSVGMLQPHIPDTPFLPVMAQRLADLITDVNTLLLQRQISLPVQSLTAVMTIVGLGGLEGVWMLKLLAQMVAAKEVDGTAPPASCWISSLRWREFGDAPQT